DRLRRSEANGERHFEQRLARFERQRERTLSAQRKVRALCLTEHLLDIAALDGFLIANQPRQLVGDALSAGVAGERRAETLEQTVHERAGEAAAAGVDLVAAPLLHCRREHRRHRHTRQRKWIDE